MAFVQFSKVSLAFGDRDILKEVSLHLAAGSRACLAGANGSGKSTLMKVIAGVINADSGDRAVQKGARISYLPQSGIVHRGGTLRAEAETVFAPIAALLAQADAIGARLALAKNGDRAVASLLEEHHRIQEQVEQSGYYRREALISLVLSGLGFSLNDLDRDTGEFSGGWQMRIALAKVLMEQPDILLLDEPTNYLDIEARSWLEGWLKTFPGGCLLVSHDRYFLDVTANEVYELFGGNLKRYAGNYSAYEQTRQAEMASLVKRYQEQQEEIAKTEALIRRFRYKAAKAAFAQELIKRLEKIERIEIPESLKRINIAIPKAPHSGKIALTLQGIDKQYGQRQVLAGLDLLVEAGERLVVAGPNGAGKSTLLRILAGEDLHYGGTLRYGAGVAAAYFSQDAAEAMTGSEQALEFIEAAAPTALVPKARDLLGAFLFRGDDVHKPVSVLSGGEKSRLALLRMLLRPVNLLVLDEPTNHLDLYSKDILLDALRQFAGTIIFVSHDRAFMEALSTKTLELSPNAAAPAQARLFYGNYAYYLDRLEREKAGETETERPDKNQNAASVSFDEMPAPEGRSISAACFREQSKRKQALVRRLERQEKEILKALDDLEQQKTRAEAELARPDVYSNAEKAKAAQRQLDCAAAAIAAKTAEWESVAAQLSTAANSTA